jgi:hypothetical protein
VNPTRFFFFFLSFLGDVNSTLLGFLVFLKVFFFLSFLGDVYRTLLGVLAFLKVFFFLSFLGDDSSSEDGEDEGHDRSSPHHRVGGGGGHHPKHDTDDEGIEKDHEEFHSIESSDRGGLQRQQHHRGGGSGGQKQQQQQQPQPRDRDSAAVERVLSLCCHHLSVKSEADSHFRAVCRALVSESIELAMFLEKTCKAKEVQQSAELQELAMADWVSVLATFLNVADVDANRPLLILLTNLDCHTCRGMPNRRRHP